MFLWMEPIEINDDDRVVADLRELLDLVDSLDLACTHFDKFAKGKQQRKTLEDFLNSKNSG